MIKDIKFGAIKSPIDLRDYKLVVSGMTLPDDYELDMCGIKNQGRVNSCVAHALSSSVEYFYKRDKKEEEEMSVGYIYGNREYSTYTGEGMIVRDAIKTLMRCGDCRNERFNYNREVPEIIDLYDKRDLKIDIDAYKNKISGYARVKKVSEIKEHLYKNGPVVISIDWYDDYDTVGDKLVHTENKHKKVGRHCMVICGWNNYGWKVQNSWGTGWGNKGCCVLDYNTNLLEAWALFDKYITDSDVKKPNGITKFLDKIVKIFYKIMQGIRKAIKK